MRRELVTAGGAFAVGVIVFSVTGARREPDETGPARRVIALAPSITEMVFALGAGERVVGVSAGVTWPPEALEVERVGGYMDTDLERIVGLRPDVILIQGLHAYVHDQAAELGIRVRRFRMKSLAEIKAAAREIGEFLGMPGAGEELAGRIDRELASVRARTRGRRPVRTFLHIAYGPALPSPPLLTTGGGTFLSGLLEVAGGENIFSDSSRPYPDVSTEALIERAPEVVMVSAPRADLKREQAEAVRAKWREILPARAGAAGGPGRPEVRVVFLMSECAQVPGPRVGEVAREMERLLWGEGGASPGPASPQRGEGGKP